MLYIILASAKFLFARSIDFKWENDRFTDAEVGWPFNNFAYSAGEISAMLSSTIVFISFFSKRFLMYFSQLQRVTCQIKRVNIITGLLYSVCV